MVKTVAETIKNTFFLVALHMLGKTSFTVSDIEAKNEVEANREAQDGTYVVKKKLLDEKAIGLATFKSIRNQAYKFHTEFMTRSYEDRGKRVLPIRYCLEDVVSFSEYDAEGCTKFRLNMPRLIFKPNNVSIRDFEAQHGRKCVTTFKVWEQGLNDANLIQDQWLHTYLGRYEHAVNVEGPNRLGKAFNSSDFPTVSELKAGYEFTWDKEVPSDYDINTMQQIFGIDEFDKIMKEQERIITNKLQAGTSKQFDTVLQFLHKFAKNVEKLENWNPEAPENKGKKSPQIKESLTGNLEQMATALRIQNDACRPEVNALADELERFAEAYPSDDIKKDSTTRTLAMADVSKQINEVETIANSMQGFTL